MLRRAVLMGLLLALCATASATAQVTLQPVDDEVFARPSQVTSDPADPDRLFIVEQAGRIQLVEDGVRHLYLDISDQVRFDSEEGLLSMALAPDFDRTGRFYIAYVRGTQDSNEPEDPDPPPLPGEHDLVISEFTTTSDTEADPLSEREVMVLDHPRDPNDETSAQHLGGQLTFGPDGHLYLSTGDASPGMDENAYAQNLGQPWGKILRFDPEQDGAESYTVPADNPFADPGDGIDDRIWSIGFRNPWRYSFDRYTDDLWIGDVGEAGWEEINYASAASGGGETDNFGWSCQEGTTPFPAGYCPTPAPAMTDPFFKYPHPSATADYKGCAVIAGFVVRDPNLPSLFGKFLFADFCNKRLMTLDPSNPSAPPVDTGLIPPSGAMPTSFGQDACGRVYIAAIVTVEQVYRLQEANGGDCVIRQVTVTVEGDGQVTGPGIACPGDCSEDVYDARRLTLQATADPQSRFAGWGGGCTGTDASCAIQVTGGDANIDASFEEVTVGGPPLPPPEPPPSVEKEPTTLTLDAARAKVRKGKAVRLTATVAGCSGRPGDLVKLRRGKARAGSAALDSNCEATFKPTVRRTATFSARIGEDELNLAASSNSVEVKVKPKPPDPPKYEEAATSQSS